MGLDSEPSLKPIGRANSIRGQLLRVSPSTVGRAIEKTDVPRFRAIPETNQESQQYLHSGRKLLPTDVLFFKLIP